MVVLEGGGLLSSGGNQYLQPDYLSPLPTTLDAKKSPLALLAQTCSQIGADSPNSKPLISTLDKPKKSVDNLPRTSPAVKEHKQRSSPPSSSSVAFKPYENTPTKKSEEVRPSSKPSDTSALSDGKKTPKSVTSDNSTPDRKSPRGASPIIRSGLEILQGHKGISPGLCCPPEQSNPAFRPHAMAAMLGYPPGGNTPYVSYARVKTPSGGEALVPVCKDPYCTGCQFSNQQMLMAGSACPSGCTQCDHQKYGLAMAAMLGAPTSIPPPFSPYICNWIAGESYCGKRFRTSEELLQHLRTHTSGSDPSTLAAQSMLNPLFSRFYPNPPLSPLSAARYHPYAKPGLPPNGLGASPYSAFNPAALNPYYSPYALYGQRLGAAVHP